MNRLQLAIFAALLSVAMVALSLRIGPTESSAESLAARVAGTDHYKCAPLAGWGCPGCYQDNPNSYHRCTGTEDLSLCQSDWNSACNDTSVDCGRFMNCYNDRYCTICYDQGACPSPSCTPGSPPV